MGAADLERPSPRGYDRKSLLALALLVSTGTAVGYHWNDLLDANGELDALLLVIWLVMAGLITWRVSPRRDVVLLCVGLCGGAVIEWWGTTTGLWRYFTGERPPLWILPAWPIAALSTDRLGQWVLGGIETVARWRRQKSQPSVSSSQRQIAYKVAYWIILPVFVANMMAFAWPARHITSTQVVFALMVLLTLHCPKPRRDVTLFIAASGLGVFLEYWGTSRQCWTYYTQEVPPVIAVVAHGFAAVAFARATDAIEAVLVRAHRAVFSSKPQRQLEKTAS